MTNPRESALVATFLDLVTARRLDDATRLALRQVEAGDRPQDVIQSLLVPAQFEAGRRWHQGTWTVAHEHQATAVADAALHRVVSAARPKPSRAAITVVCAEGDWHTLASRMAAELLRLDGWQVTFLGGPVPMRDLVRWLRETRPAAVVVTCSMPTFGRGVLNVATAAAALGIPVVAGGRGMGPDARRATALGVGWASRLDLLAATLSAGPPPIDCDAHATRVTVSDRLTSQRTDIVNAAMGQLGRSWPRLHTLPPEQLARAAEDFGHILDFVAATILLNDAHIFTEFIDWLTELLTARGMQSDVVTASLDALTKATPPEFRLAHDILTTAVHNEVSPELP